MVDRKPPPIIAQSLDEVVVFGNKVCTWEGTWADDYVRKNHPGAVRIPKKTILDIYNGLHDGDCDFAIEAVASWSKLKTLKEYNPFCDLYWVGGDRKVSEIYASMVGKVDSGVKCTGFIRDVINLHMHDMISEGFLSNAWDREYRRTQDINCDTYRPEIGLVLEEQLNAENSTDEDGRRLQSSTDEARARAIDRAVAQRRKLKGAGAKAGAAGGAVAAASAAGGSEGDATRLTLPQMIGTFAFHWSLMGLALVLANVNALYVRYLKSRKEKYAVNKMEHKMENSNGSTTKRTVEMTECFENEDGVEFAEKVPDDWQGQLDQMRRSQNQMRQSQLQMEHYQRQMQQSQIALIQEQRKLQGQIQQLLGAQVTKRASPDGTLNSSLTDWDTQALIPPSASTDAPLHSSFTEWEA